MSVDITYYHMTGLWLEGGKLANLESTFGTYHDFFEYLDKTFPSGNATKSGSDIVHVVDGMSGKYFAFGIVHHCGDDLGVILCDTIKSKDKKDIINKFKECFPAFAISVNEKDIKNIVFAHYS